MDNKESTLKLEGMEAVAQKELLERGIDKVQLQRPILA